MFYAKKIQKLALTLLRHDHIDLCKAKMKDISTNLAWLIVGISFALSFYPLINAYEFSNIVNLFALISFGLFFLWRFVFLQTFWLIQNEKARLARVLELLEKTINLSLFFTALSLLVGVLSDNLNLFYLSSLSILLIMSIQKRELKTALLASNLIQFMRKLNLIKDAMFWILSFNFALAMTIG